MSDSSKIEEKRRFFIQKKERVGRKDSDLTLLKIQSRAVLHLSLISRKPFEEEARVEEWQFFVTRMQSFLISTSDTHPDMPSIPRFPLRSHSPVASALLLSISFLSLKAPAVENSGPVSLLLYHGARNRTGDAVPGNPLASFATFGIPSINDSGQVAFTAGIRTGETFSTIVFANGGVVAQKGNAAPGTQTTFQSFKDPALNNAGDVAFLATLDGKPPKVGLFTSLNTNTQPEIVQAPLAKGLSLVVLEGTALTELPGVSIDSISAFVLTDSEIYFTATLTGTGVTSANKNALFGWDGTRHLLLRTGDRLGTKRVKSFSVLDSPAPGSGQGRSADFDGSVVFRVVFTNGTQALYSHDGTTPVSATQTGQTAPGLRGGITMRRFGLPIVNAGGGLAFRASLGAAPRTANEAIFAEVNGLTHRIFGRGDRAPGITGVKLGYSSDPIYNLDESVAAINSLTGSHVTSANKTALVYTPSGSSTEILARLGNQPPDVPAGAQYQAFKAIVLPTNQNGPAFLATMKPGLGGVTKTNLTGLWATDTQGTLHLIAREGNLIGQRTIRTLTILSHVTGSPGQTRSYNTAQQFVYRVNFTDGTEGIILISLAPQNNEDN